MADDALLGIDDAFAKAKHRVHRPSPANLTRRPEQPMVAEESLDALREEGWSLGWLECFIAIQFLWGVALFVPGAQGVRTIVRALPYVSSLGLLVYYGLQPSARRQPSGSPLLVAALSLLVVNLLHSTTALTSGIAQCVFQLSIAAPMFWAQNSIRGSRQLSNILVAILVMNFASAGLGLLQVYFPDRFLPQFSQALDADWTSSMKYVSSDGTIITRPPGLTDTPGGAAVAGGITAILGLGLCLTRRAAWQKAAMVCMSGVGLAAIYFAQTRSVLVMAIAAIVVIAALTLKQGRIRSAGLLIATGGAIVLLAFMWAASVGGESVERRFVGLQQAGALQTYSDTRGQFLDHTMKQLLDLYPFGAGVGRWGMMNAYFGEAGAKDAAPIYVEIQLTGWLLDGGVLMWVFYGGAILVSILAGVRLCSSPDPAFSQMAVIGVALQVFVAGMAMAGPTFNTQLGILFWMIAALLSGVHRIVSAQTGHW